MVAVSVAWKHTFQLTGDLQNRHPSTDGWNPTTVMGAGVLYSAGELANIADDNDATFVNANINHAAGNTGRSSHLWRFDGVAEAIIAPLTFLTRFTHLISGNFLGQRHKLYIWNDDSGIWEQIANLLSSSPSRTYSGTKTLDLFEYVNPAGEIFVFHYDWEGVHQTAGGGGGCLHADTLVTLEGGVQCLARNVRFADRILCCVGGEIVPVKVDETTFHHAASRHMVTVWTAPNGAFYHVTDNHWCPVDDGWKRADEMEVGDPVPDMWGNLNTVTRVELSEEVCEVVDLNMRDPFPSVLTYPVNGGLLTCNMAAL